MEITLTPDLERFIAEKVESGEYESAEDVMRAALQLLSEEDEEHEALRALLDPAIEEFERGELVPGPEAVEQATAEFRRLTGRAP
jgi:antitoxin ParD1/3/4